MNQSHENQSNRNQDNRRKSNGNQSNRGQSDTHIARTYDHAHSRHNRVVTQIKKEKI